MKVNIQDYQNKAAMLKKALVDADHELANSWADVLLIDGDFPLKYYQDPINKAVSEGGKVVLYSHGAPVITAWDGIWEPSEYTSLYLAQSVGQMEVMQGYGYAKPIEVIGWHFCKQKKYQGGEIKRVLFAPWHPLSDGWMIPAGKALNTSVYSRLLSMPYELTVRHVKGLEDNGLWMVSGVTYELANMSIGSAVKSIDAADIVVTNYGTLAALAVARGKPLVVYGQDIPPHDGYNLDTLRYVQSWDLYKDWMRYPYDISATKQKATKLLMEFAAEHEAEEWRERFIGDSFDGGKFIAIMEGLINDDY